MWERLANAVAMKSDLPLLYSVAALPAQLSWGPAPANPGDDDLSAYITLNARPLRVMIIGEVMHTSPDSCFTKQPDMSGKSFCKTA